jgi:hypothetical protein
MPSLRLSRLLLLAGFVGIVAGTITWMVGGSVTSGSWLIQQLAAPIGYGLVGWAWWQWMQGSSAGSMETRAVRRSSRTLALASAVTSLAYFASLYGNLRFRYATHYPLYPPHFNLHNEGYGAAGVGFLLAAVAFWIAPAATRSAEPGRDSDSDLVT